MDTNLIWKQKNSPKYCYFANIALQYTSCRKMNEAEASQSSESAHEQDNSETICEICKMASKQIECILHSLLDSLREISSGEVEEHLHDNGGFSKLLRMIFHSRCKNFRDTVKCKHYRARQFFLTGLQTNVTHLNKLCNKKLNALAKYNFHLDTISQQIKTFTRHFSGGDKKKIVGKPKQKQREISADHSGNTQKTQKKGQEKKSQSPKQATVKQQAEPPASENIGLPSEYLYHHMPGSYPYHQLTYSSEYAHIMNNMLMMNYGYNPANQP